MNESTANAMRNPPPSQHASVICFPGTLSVRRCFNANHRPIKTTRSNKLTGEARGFVELLLLYLSLQTRVVQYCDITTFMIIYDRYHKVSPNPNP